MKRYRGLIIFIAVKLLIFWGLRHVARRLSDVK